MLVQALRLYVLPGTFTYVSSILTHAYFEEQPDRTFDRTLRAGIAPTTNAVELLARAGYPPELLARVAKTSDRRSRA